MGNPPKARKPRFEHVKGGLSGLTPGLLGLSSSEKFDQGVVPPITACLKALDVNPKTISEVGMGTNPKNIELLVGGLQDLESYSVYERGRIPDEHLRQVKEKLGDAWDKVRFTRGDYIGLNSTPTDMVLFSNLFTTLVYYPQAVLGKAIVDLNPRGVVVMKESVHDFKTLSKGDWINNIYTPEMFRILADGRLDVKFFEEKEGGVKQTNMPTILSSPEESSDDTIYVTIKKPRNMDEDISLMIAIQLGDNALQTEEKDLTPSLTPHAEQLVLGWKKRFTEIMDKRYQEKP